MSPLPLNQMSPHLPTLLHACIAALVLSAAFMTAFGLRQKVYRGYRWWAAAQWLLVAGLLLQLLTPQQPMLLAAAHLLVLQWPVTVLAGMRRFYSRHGLMVPGAADVAVLCAGWLLAPLALALHAAPALQSAAWPAGALLLHVYAALMTSRLAEFKGSVPLQTLAASHAVAGVVHLAQIATLYDAAPASGQELLATSLVMPIPAWMLVFLALLLTFGRTEHTWLAVQRKLRYLADMDVVTRVANRRHFQELATSAMVDTEPGSAAVMMLDIDHFKRINDMFGHACGDEALRQVAQCVRDTLREQDVAGRLGGDEFALLLPDTSPKGAMAVAMRIVANLATHNVAPRIAPLSLSFGIVLMHGDETIADALRRADQALHEAKRQGRNRVVVATGSSDRLVFSNSRTLGLATP
jgi:diguanylate cyclase